jgi:hypothetical protein
MLASGTTTVNRVDGKIMQLIIINKSFETHGKIFKLNFLNGQRRNGQRKIAKIRYPEFQCCGSGSGIRCIFDLLIRDFRDPDPG